MEKQTFINNMTERGYELWFVNNGNVNATKGEKHCTTRAARQLHCIYRHPDRVGDSPQGRDGRRNATDSRRTDRLTIQP